MYSFGDLFRLSAVFTMTGNAFDFCSRFNKYRDKTTAPSIGTFIFIGSYMCITSLL